MTETKSPVQKHVEACDGVIEMRNSGSKGFEIEVDGSRTIGDFEDVYDTLPVLWMINQIVDQENGTTLLKGTKYSRVS